MKDFFTISDPKQKTSQADTTYRNSSTTNTAPPTTRTVFNNNNGVTNTQQQRRPNTNYQPRALANTTSNDGSNPVVCNCSNPAQLLTVRKEGVNQGRQFYACSTKSCEFFLWADSTNNVNNDTGNNDDDDNNGNNIRNNNGSNNRFNRTQPNKKSSYNNNNNDNNNSNSGGVSCNCGAPATL